MEIELAKISKKIVETLIHKTYTIATAESCTGGLISAHLTDVPGSSQCLRGGACTYTEDAKSILLGIPHDEIRAKGVVSKEIAMKMASSIRQILHSNFAVSTTGVAGPGGGSLESPVGTVWYGVATPDSCEAFCLHLEGNRNMIRKGAVTKILTHLYDQYLKESS